MTKPTIAGINLEQITTTALTISGVTVQNITQMPLWVNVPILPREFVGRDELVTSLVARLTAGKSTALSAAGLPGVGKTALAIVLAHHPAVLAHFTDGVLWAGLGPQGDAMSALTAWGNALGVDVSDQPTSQHRSQVVRNAVGQRRLLLMIDDAWDLAAAELLRCGGPGCAHLLTTRDQALARAFAGARHEVAVPELADDPAFDLLRRLAPEACAADSAAARRLAQSVGGLPLALELVGGFLAAPGHAFFPELSAEAWKEMADPARRLQLATVRLGALDGRPVTLQDTIALSLMRLPQPAVNAFHALGAFAPKPATFDLAAAKAVTEADLLILATLVACSLLEQVDAKILGLQKIISEVARTALPLAAIERHRDHYLALVDEDLDDWQHIQTIYPQVQQALIWQVAREPGAPPPPAAPAKPKITILFLAANPSDTNHLRLDEEVRAIDEALQKAKFRDAFDLQQHWAVRPADLQGLLLRYQPHIVHFSGHGSAAGKIMLEDATGKARPVSQAALSTLFGLLKDNLRVVVLNACYSQPQAEAIAEHIDCVVGMSEAIDDKMAISFAAAFYRALAYGRNVQTAFGLARNQAQLEGLPDENVPQLLAPNANPAQIAFARL
jgi:hypothetical protein